MLHKRTSGRRRDDGAKARTRCNARTPCSARTPSSARTPRSARTWRSARTRRRARRRRRRRGAGRHAGARRADGRGTAIGRRRRGGIAARQAAWEAPSPRHGGEAWAPSEGRPRWQGRPRWRIIWRETAGDNAAHLTPRQLDSARCGAGDAHRHVGRAGCLRALSCRAPDAGERPGPEGATAARRRQALGPRPLRSGREQATCRGRVALCRAGGRGARLPGGCSTGCSRCAA